MFSLTKMTLLFFKFQRLLIRLSLLLFLLLLTLCSCATEPRPPAYTRTSSSSTFSTAAYNIDDHDYHHHDVDPLTKRLTIDTMCQQLRKMEYAVRGKVVIAADKIADELKINPNSHPFDHIVYTNIGNPHSVGQKPLTWPRQVLALVDLPDEVGVNHPAAEKMFPIDAIERAKEIKVGLDGFGTGAYSHSKGARCFREDVSHFIEARDGMTSGGNVIKSDPESIFLTNGASAGIVYVLKALISSANTGIMIPIPQYPIYSATIDLLGGHKVGYYMDEANHWALNVEELERSLAEATAAGITTTALVLINPGNPTGQVLSKKNLFDIIDFCVRHKLVLLADEVYQDNVYDDDKQFISAKRAAYDAGYLREDLTSELELISFHSISKGLFGECGRRGGYMELVGIDQDVNDALYKLASSNLCSTTSGQIMTSLMCRGPKPTDVSYESFESEKRSIYESLKRRSKLVSDGLNSIDGFSCQPAAGAMYCFPSIQIPPKAITEATKQGLSPDTLYAVDLLENTGICIVPASGFGQKSGRYGFRTTFLPSESEMQRCVDLIRSHYNSFKLKYSTDS